MKNVKTKKIDQHKNSRCQMQSLERTLIMVSLLPFSVFSPKGIHFGNQIALEIPYQLTILETKGYLKHLEHRKHSLLLHHL